MTNEGFVLALAGLLAAAPVHAGAPAALPHRLEQRAAERGPIRRQLEAALTASAAEIAVHSLAVEHKDVRRASSQGTASRVLACAVVTVLLLAILVFWVNLSNPQF